VDGAGDEPAACIIHSMSKPSLAHALIVVEEVMPVRDGPRKVVCEERDDLRQDVMAVRDLAVVLEDGGRTQDLCDADQNSLMAPDQQAERDASRAP